MSKPDWSILEGMDLCETCKGVGKVFCGDSRARPAFPDCPECKGSGFHARDLDDEFAKLLAKDE